MSATLQQLPVVFEKILLDYLKHHYLKKGHADTPWNNRDTEYFAKGVIELNASFTSTRSSKAFNYFSDPVMRSGYLAYFLPVNAMKAYTILSRFGRIDIKDGAHIKIADIGSGPLTLSFGFLFCLADMLRKKPQARITIAIDAFEQNKKILSDGKNIFMAYLRASGLDKQISVRINEFVGPFHSRILSSRKSGAHSYNYLLLGNILNEFERRESQSELVLDILARMAKPGATSFFLEPGSKKSSRDLQALRDDIIANSGFRVVAPCLHQNTCPLNLTAKGDWCHFTESWQQPRFIRDFDTLTDLKKTYLLYSYLLLVNEPQAAPLHTAQEFVAISDAMPEKGRLDIVGCGVAGRVRFLRSNRDRTDVNAAFDKIRRGVRFTIPDYQHDGEFKLTENSSVRPNTAVYVR